jgi:hypothetical protein
MTPEHLKPGAIARLIADSVTTLDPKTRQPVGMMMRRTLMDVVGTDPNDPKRTIVFHAGATVSVLSADLGPA